MNDFNLNELNSGHDKSNQSSNEAGGKGESSSNEQSQDSRNDAQATSSKIAHRTRSKYPLKNQSSFFDFESKLPIELLLDFDNDDNDDIYKSFVINTQTGILINEDDHDPDFLFNENDNNVETEIDSLRVPKKEAAALVRDAVEFVGGSIYENQKMNKNQTGPFADSRIVRRSNDNRDLQQQQQQQQIYIPIAITSNDSQDSLTCNSVSKFIQDHVPVQNSSNEVNEAPQLNNEATSSKNTTDNSQDLNEMGEYIPQFNENQLKQLNEQLRNHIQLLAQTCLLCCFKGRQMEDIFKEAFDLLNVFDRMQDFYSENNQNNFEILNLKEAIKIVSDNEHLISESEAEVNRDQSKYTEIIVNSPVFYNLKLIPTCKYKYQSQFSRAQFSDPELKLLRLGYDKFKHLSKQECSQCIKEYLLPIRTREEISRKLNDVIRGGGLERKDRKRLDDELLIQGLKFDREKDYKSPLEKSENHPLPSIYTVTIERMRMARLLKDKKELDQIHNKNADGIIRRGQKRHHTPSEWLDERLNTYKVYPNESIDLSELNRKCELDKSVNTMNSTAPTVDLNSTMYSTIDLSEDTTTTTPHESTQYVHNSFNFNSNSNAMNNDANLNKRVLNSSNVNTIVPSFTIPSNFCGTIMIQPTVHVYTNGKVAVANGNNAKYRKIVPKTSHNTTSK